MRRIIWCIILFFLLFMGGAGLYNGSQDFLNATSIADRVLAVTVTTYGITGLISFLGLLGKRSWAMIPLLIFSIAATFAGTFASIYYSPPETRWISGVASGGICIVLMMFIVVQVRHEMLRY